MKARILNSREQILVTAAGALAICFGGWFAALKPLYELWKNKESSVLVQEHFLNENLKIISQKEWIERRYAELTSNLKAKGSDEQDVSLMQDEIGALAKLTGVKVNKTKPRPIENKPDTKRCLIELDCEGNLVQLADFIYRMQVSPEVLRVEELRLSLENQKESLLRAALLVSKVLIVE